MKQAFVANRQYHSQAKIVQTLMMPTHDVNVNKVLSRPFSCSMGLFYQYAATGEQRTVYGNLPTASSQSEMHLISDICVDEWFIQKAMQISDPIGIIFKDAHLRTFGKSGTYQ